MAKPRTILVRITAAEKRSLEADARRKGIPTGTVAANYIAEGVRRSRFPSGGVSEWIAGTGGLSRGHALAGLADSGIGQGLFGQGGSCRQAYEQTTRNRPNGAGLCGGLPGGN